MSSRFTLVRPGFGHGAAYHETIEVVHASAYEELQVENDHLRAVLEQIAMPRRPDGSFNRGREACQQLAEEALKPSTLGSPDQQSKFTSENLDAIRATVHGHVNVIRGMCSDEIDHREIDRALVRLDDAVNPLEEEHP